MEAGDCEKNEDKALIEDTDGLDKIEDLQTRENTDIYNLAVSIFKIYLADDEDQSQPMAGPNYPFLDAIFYGCEQQSLRLSTGIDLPHNLRAWEQSRVEWSRLQSNGFPRGIIDWGNRQPPGGFWVAPINFGAAV